MSGEVRTIGTFQLGGCKWIVEAKSQDGTFRYRYDIATCKAMITLMYDGRVLSDNTVAKNVYQMVTQIALQRVMMKRSSIYENAIDAFSALSAQVMLQLDKGIADGTLYNIGSSEYRIEYNNKDCDLKDVYGFCCPNTKHIVLGTRTKEGTEYSKEFMMATFLHEAYHGINDELGLGNCKWNSESTVNTIAHLMTEVYHTMFLTFKTTDNGHN